MHRIAGLVLLACCVWLALPPAARGQHLTKSQPYYIRVVGGVSFPRLTEVNDRLHQVEDYLREQTGRNPGWEYFGLTPEFGFEFGARLSRKVVGGVRYSSQKASIANSFEDESARLSLSGDYDILEVSGRLVFGPSGPSGFYGGVSAGVAWAEYHEDIDLTDFFNPSASQHEQRAVSGSDPSFGAFCGYCTPVSGSIAFTAEVGGQLRKMGQLKSENRLYSLASDGHRIDFDFSGFGLQIGVVVTMGSLFGPQPSY